MEQNISSLKNNDSSKLFHKEREQFSYLHPTRADDKNKEKVDNMKNVCIFNLK